MTESPEEDYVLFFISNRSANDACVIMLSCGLSECISPREERVIPLTESQARSMRASIATAPKYLVIEEIPEYA